MNDFNLYPRYKEFAGKKILSIDYGTKVIGTAMYTPRVDPFPIGCEKIIYKDDDHALKEIKSIVENEGVDVLVIGVPYYIDGNESENTKKIKAFAERLKSFLNDYPLFEQDETLTTKTAQERMLNSPEYNFKIDMTRIDVLSAIIILEDFIRQS